MGEPRTSRHFPGALLDTIEEIVIVHGVVMGQKQPLHVRGRGDLRHIRVRAVSPVFLCRILFGRVLRVVNHHIGVLHERGMAPVALMQNGFEPARLGVRSPKAFPVGLVIAEIEDGNAVGFDPVTQRNSGMIQKLRGDANAAQVVCAFPQIAVSDLRSQLGQLDREIRVFHLPGKHFGQRTVRALRPAHRQAVSRNEQRREEGKSLDVIPVSMAEQNGCLDRLGSVAQQVAAQGARAGAAIENESGARVRHHLDAGGVPAIADRRSTRRGDGTPRSPESQQHKCLSTVLQFDGIEITRQFVGFHLGFQRHPRVWRHFRARRPDRSASGIRILFLCLSFCGRGS